MYKNNLATFGFREISDGAKEVLDKNPNIWNNRLHRIKKKPTFSSGKTVTTDRVTKLPKIINSNEYISGLNARYRQKANLNNLKKLGIVGGVGALGYLGYQGYKKAKNLKAPDIQIGDETDREVLSKIGKGTKWAVTATASGKALDSGRRFLGYHYANNKLKKPFNLSNAQVSSYRNTVKSGGALGDLKRNYDYLSGIGNIGQKTGKFLSTKAGRRLALGGVGALGAGLYGYNKAKEYYLI